MHRVSEEFLKSFFFIVSCFKHYVNLFKTIVNLFSYGKKQRISTLYENNHYIIPHIKKLLIFQCIFLFLPQDIHKKSYLFHKLKDMKSWYSGNNYNLRNYSQAFLKALHCTCLTRFRVFLRFWVSRILNMSLVLKMQRLWVYQSSEYASVTQGNWICQNISGFVWICRNMSKYAWICRNLCEELLLYVSLFPHLFYNPFLHEHVVTYLNVYKTLEVTVWRNMRLFSWRDTIWFVLSSWKYLIVFYFRLNILTSKILICRYISEPMDRGGRVVMTDHQSRDTLLVFCFSLVKTCKEIT